MNEMRLVLNDGRVEWGGPRSQVGQDTGDSRKATRIVEGKREQKDYGREK